MPILAPSSPSISAGTVQAVLDEARLLLNDPTKVRYPESYLLVMANNAFLEAYRVRPDLFFSTITAGWVDKLATDTFPLPDFLRPAVVNYVIARAELRSALYDDKGKLAALFADFRQQLLSV